MSRHGVLSAAGVPGLLVATVAWCVLAMPVGAKTPESMGDDLDSAWRQLGSERIAEAYEAVRRFAEAGDAAVAFLADRIELPIAPREHIDRLIAELDADDFNRRRRAQRKLADLGPVAEQRLRAAWARPDSFEQQTRIVELLRIDHEAADADLRRARRGVELLGTLATPAARQRLEQWRQRAQAQKQEMALHCHVDEALTRAQLRPDDHVGRALHWAALGTQLAAEPKRDRMSHRNDVQRAFAALVTWERYDQALAQMHENGPFREDLDSLISRVIDRRLHQPPPGFDWRRQMAALERTLTFFDLPPRRFARERAWILVSAGRTAQAAQVLEQVDDPRERLDQLLHVSRQALRGDDDDDASAEVVSMTRRTLDALAEQHGDDDAQVNAARMWLAEMLLSAGRDDPALGLIGELELPQKVNPEENWNRSRALGRLLDALIDRQQWDAIHALNGHLAPQRRDRVLASMAVAQAAAGDIELMQQTLNAIAGDDLRASSHKHTETARLRVGDWDALEQHLRGIADDHHRARTRVNVTTRWLWQPAVDEDSLRRRLEALRTEVAPHLDLEDLAHDLPDLYIRAGMVEEAVELLNTIEDIPMRIGSFATTISLAMEDGFDAAAASLARAALDQYLHHIDGQLGPRHAEVGAAADPHDEALQASTDEDRRFIDMHMMFTILTQAGLCPEAEWLWIAGTGNARAGLVLGLELSHSIALNRAAKDAR